jgi:hypothetical protein
MGIFNSLHISVPWSLMNPTVVFVAKNYCWVAGGCGVGASCRDSTYAISFFVLVAGLPAVATLTLRRGIDMMWSGRITMMHGCMPIAIRGSYFRA